MSRIKAKNTSPEVFVRTAVRRLGLRPRLHSKKLPGKPDLILSDQKIAIFVHGCFWHLHKSCGRGHIPKSNKGYWVPKLKRNVSRFTSVKRSLRKLGWQTLVIWECETKEPLKFEKRIGQLKRLFLR